MNLREYRAAAHLLQQKGVKARTPESTLLNEVMAVLCRLPGVQAIRMNTGMANHAGRYVRYGYPGMSDIYCRVGITKCDPCKRTLWMELKAKGGVMSDSQQAFREQTGRWGDAYAIVQSVDDALKAIDEVRNG